MESHTVGASFALLLSGFQGAAGTHEVESRVAELTFILRADGLERHCLLRAEHQHLRLQLALKLRRRAPPQRPVDQNCALGAKSALRRLAAMPCQPEQESTLVKGFSFRPDRIHRGRASGGKTALVPSARALDVLHGALEGRAFRN